LLTVVVTVLGFPGEDDLLQEAISVILLRLRESKLGLFADTCRACSSSSYKVINIVAIQQTALLKTLTIFVLGE
jgi:hypothetical protein